MKSRVLPFAAAVAFAACTEQPRPISRAEIDAWNAAWTDSARAIAVELTTERSVQACGTRSSVADGTWLIVSGEQCLTCRDVGWLLRRLRETASPMAPVQLLTAASDTGVVCDYLTLERVRLPVFAYRARGPLAKEAPLMAVILEGGNLKHIFIGADGLSLVDSLAEIGAASRQ